VSATIAFHSPENLSKQDSMLVRLLNILVAAAVFAILAGSSTAAVAHTGHKAPIEVVQATMEMAKINAAAEERAAKATASSWTNSAFLTATGNRSCNGDCDCSPCSGHCHCVPAMMTQEFVIQPLPKAIPKSVASDPAFYLEQDATEQPPKSFA
jgi:hypothetical protein